VGVWHGGTCPPPTPVRAGHGNCRSPKRKNGGGVEKYRIVLAKQNTNYAEICILVTKYISKLYKNTIQITCHVFNYIFQILVFQLLDNSANRHAEQPRFLLATRVLLINTQNCAWFNSQISVICCEFSRGFAPTSHQGLCHWALLGDFRPPDPLCLPPPNPGYATEVYTLLVRNTSKRAACRIDSTSNLR